MNICCVGTLRGTETTIKLQIGRAQPDGGFKSKTFNTFLYHLRIFFIFKPKVSTELVFEVLKTSRLNKVRAIQTGKTSNCLPKCLSVLLSLYISHLNYFFLFLPAFGHKSTVT